MNPMFELAKNFIVEGLTYKIDSREKNSLGKELSINIQPRVYFEHEGAVNPFAQPEEAAQIRNPLSGLFDSALAQRSGQPTQMNKGKLYANYMERKQDEEFEVKKDVVRKNVLGSGMMNLFKGGLPAQQQPAQMA